MSVCACAHMHVYRSCKKEIRSHFMSHVNPQETKLHAHSFALTFAHCFGGFPGGSDGKESTCNAGDLGSVPGSRGSAGEGNGYPLQYSCLENPMQLQQKTLHLREVGEAVKVAHFEIYYVTESKGMALTFPKYLLCTRPCPEFCRK